MSMTAPPPDASASQNQSAWKGPLWISVARKRIGLPMPPWSMIALVRSSAGEKRMFSPYMPTTPAASAAAMISSASATVRASGFSTRNGLPAAIAARATSWCRPLGTVMSTPSTSGLSTSSR